LSRIKACLAAERDISRVPGSSVGTDLQSRVVDSGASSRGFCQGGDLALGRSGSGRPALGTGVSNQVRRVAADETGMEGGEDVLSGLSCWWPGEFALARSPRRPCGTDGRNPPSKMTTSSHADHRPRADYGLLLVPCTEPFRVAAIARTRDRSPVPGTAMIPHRGPLGTSRVMGRNRITMLSLTFS